MKKIAFLLWKMSGNIKFLQEIVNHSYVVVKVCDTLPNQSKFVRKGNNNILPVIPVIFETAMGSDCKIIAVQN